MSRPSLSIGIPVFNQAGTIRETVRSVLNQTEPFDRILVSDNHSNDGTSELLKEFGDRIEIIRPPEFLSMTDNWNFCIKNLHTDWVSLLSGDDLIFSDFASEVRKAMSLTSDAVLVRGDWDFIDDSGNLQEHHRQLSVSTVTCRPKTWTEQLNGPKVNFASFAVKRAVWEKVGGFPRQFHLFQDWMFWLLISPHGSFIRVPKIIAAYRNQARVVLEKKRVPLRISDEYNFSLKILPNVSPGSLSRSTIRQARRFRLKNVLNYAAEHVGNQLDETSIRYLKEMGNACGQDGLVEKWLKSPHQISPHPLDRLKHLAKGAVRRLMG